MREILSVFSKIGTNPDKYISNYFVNINDLMPGDEIFIDHKNSSLYCNKILVFDGKSTTTLRQNIDCWISLGLVVKKSNDILIKIKQRTSKEKIYKFVKDILLVEDFDESINNYRNTIIVKLLVLNNINDKLLTKHHISMRSKELTYQDIIDEIGQFEKYISKDKDYINVLKTLWGAKCQ